MAVEASNLKILRLAGQDVSLDLRRDRRARRLTLRLNEATGAIHLVLPWGVPVAQGLDFAHRRRDWILKQIEGLPPRVPFEAGARVPYLGEDHEIRSLPAARRGVWREDGAILVSGRPEHLARRVGDFLKAEARRELTTRAHAKAARSGRAIARISIRDTRSRWGSCSSDGAISLSWRLVLAPEAVLDYVVAHEVAHLTHMNHGPRFWKLAAKLTPEVEAPRRWLRRNGGALHRYG